MIHFHGEDVRPSVPEDALFHILPVPFEHSVTYGSGTAAGPAAILEASAQLELPAAKTVPAEHGIHTAAALDCAGSAAEVLERIEKAVAGVLAYHAIPVILGGEHTVTSGAISALSQQYDDFGVVQFDAHADLRDSYEGSGYNHACVMRRIHEQNIPIYQLGTRSYSLEEMEYRRQHDIPYLNAEETWKQGTLPQLTLPADFPEQIYLTFDIDALDSAVLPATGTPVPGGLNWYQAMWLIEQLMDKRVCIGFDVVELAPIAALHASSFAAAQLTYNIMGYLAAGTRNREYWLKK